MGPWWVGADPERWLRPHAPPYGWGLALPHRLILPFASSLWQAMGAMLHIQAALAPLAVGLLWRGGLGPALAGGLAVALDPGLLDSAWSGSKGYLGGLWAGLMTLALRHPTSRPLAPAALAMAAMNHPLLLALLPWLEGLELRQRRDQLGLACALALLLPRLAQPGGPWPDSTPGLGPALAALASWLPQPTAAMGLLCLIGALFSVERRREALRGLASLGLLLGMGAGLGYLRDYHLRLLCLPLLSLWPTQGRARLLPLLGLLLLRWPADPLDHRGAALRPGSLGLERLLADELARRPERPLAIDGAWLSASPAAEPGALALDLHLRGWTAQELAPGGSVAVVISAERPDLADLPTPGLLLRSGDRWRLSLAQPEELRQWSAALCGAQPRLGGAWDGLAFLHPELQTQELAWWDCPITSSQGL